MTMPPLLSFHAIPQTSVTLSRFAIDDAFPLYPFRAAPVWKVLSLLRREMYAVHKRDMDVAVQPGVGWQLLNEELGKDDLYFPMDPGPGACIGGMIATGYSETNAYRYGTMKDWVVSLTVTGGRHCNQDERSPEQVECWIRSDMGVRGRKWNAWCCHRSSCQDYFETEERSAFPGIHSAGNAAVKLVQKELPKECRLQYNAHFRDKSCPFRAPFDTIFGDSLNRAVHVTASRSLSGLVQSNATKSAALPLSHFCRPKMAPLDLRAESSKVGCLCGIISWGEGCSISPRLAAQEYRSRITRATTGSNAASNRRFNIRSHGT